MNQPKGINILITGTPGTGKTSLAETLAQDLDGFEHIEVGKIVKENHFYTVYDAELDTHLISEDNEDRLLDFLEPVMVEEGHHVVDYHSSDLFPERWFHLVVVLHASTEVLFDRLTARGYSEAKRAENMEAEIQCVCEEEARQSYRDEIIMIVINDTLDQLAATVDRIQEVVNEIKASRGL
ncbi:unnamed protein product [Phytomonas sp. Hart1]|nr:unnamed protein product [Phytomonas sp. Hart1]|eukprot:CCW68077.1 unnamed protein product [Phytomonas sp. isolate Hart1]